MDASSSPTGGPPRRHARNTSQPMVRRSTRGPLDESDDPLTDTSTGPQTPSVTSPQSVSAPRQSLDSKPLPPHLPEPALALGSQQPLDLRFLQDPSVYHSLTTEDISTIFLDAPNQPPPDEPLSELLQNGHFRRAAITAAFELVQSSATTDVHRALQLLYTRLACLILIQRPDLASQEALPMTEVLARDPPLAKALSPFVPWELRLLLVRLQSIGAADGGRRGIMALYALASEVRSQVQAARTDDNETELEVLSQRLQDIGLRVADSLVELGEIETATRHFDTLTDIASKDTVFYRKALLRTRVGDVLGAQTCVENISEANSNKRTLYALLQVANGQTISSLAAWEALLKDSPDDVLVANNLAVTLLYTGQIFRSREILENVAHKHPAFPGLLFNLSTVYELTTENAVGLKTSLLQQASEKAPIGDSGGWERANIEVKL